MSDGLVALGMTSDVIARVDAWMAQNTSPSVWWLKHDWEMWCRALAARETDRGRSSAEAAMRGILTDLVREAWGQPTVYVAMVRTRKGNCFAVGYMSKDGPECIDYADTEVYALVTALEAAPRSQKMFPRAFSPDGFRGPTIAIETSEQEDASVISIRPKDRCEICGEEFRSGEQIVTPHNPGPDHSVSRVHPSCIAGQRPK